MKFIPAPLFFSSSGGDCPSSYSDQLGQDLVSPELHFILDDLPPFISLASSFSILLPLFRIYLSQSLVSHLPFFTHPSLFSLFSSLELYPAPHTLL